jgi:two-component system cell cycle response regulator
MRMVRLVQAAAVGGVVGYGLQATIPACRNLAGDGFETWSYPALFALAALLCFTRGAVSSEQRAAWIVLGTGLLASGAGDVYWNVAIGDAVPPSFTPADALWIAFYPACLGGLALLARDRLRRLDAGVAVDGLIGALGLTAVGAALVFGALLSERALYPEDFTMDAVMMFGDLALLGAAVAVLTVTAWRPGRALGLVCGAVLMSAVVDGFSIWQGATGAEIKTTGVETLLPAAAVLIGLAAWQAPARRTAVVAEGWRAIALPAAFACTALALLVLNLATGVNAIAIALATATLAAVVVRMALALGQHMKLLAASREEAHTDALTGLANRRRLMTDLEQVADAAAHGEPHTVLMFDLDGFKEYNDWHGHPAGDVLLQRVGERLSGAAAEFGRAYRLGGDEFCVIAAGDELTAQRVRDAALDALSEDDEGFQVTSSCGLVMLPRDATTAPSVLQLADERLYAQKARRRSFAPGRRPAAGAPAAAAAFVTGEPARATAELDAFMRVPGSDTRSAR